MSYHTQPWPAAGIVAALLLSQSSPARAAEPLARMSYDEPVWCLRDAKDTEVFAQCDDKRKVCLYHRGCMPGSRGPDCRRMERTKGCSAPPVGRRFARLVQEGFAFEPAIAEAPPGWTRDEHGRVFQTEFDMGRRVWIGGGYTPRIGGERRDVGRARVEAGLQVEWLSYDARDRYRFRILDSEVRINPLQVDATLLRFDQSKDSETPFLRLTTFWPEPRRHDAFMNVGWWASVMGIGYRPRGSADETHMRFAGVGPTLDMWQSLDLQSYVRLRAGGGFDDLLLEREGAGHRIALTPLAALEGAFAFDRAGIYRLGFSAGYEAPLVFLQGSAAGPSARSRALGSLDYEMVLVAVNDQPLTLRLGVDGGYRDDLVPEASGWEIGFGAGLRVNLWAPAPRADERERIERKRSR